MATEERYTRAPEYKSSEDLPRGPSALVAPLNVAMPSVAGVAEAAAAFGKEVAQFGLLRARAQDETRAARARVDFNTRLGELYQQYESDPDYKTAPERLKSDAEAERDRLLGGILDPHRRAVTELQMQPHMATALRGIKVFAVAREAQFNQQALGQTRAATRAVAGGAISPRERAEALAGFDDAADAGAAVGFITPQRADAEKRGLRAELDADRATQLIRADPAAAASALSAGDDFPFLDPLAHARLTEAAYQAEAAAPAAAQAQAEASAFKAARDGTLDLSHAGNDAIPPSVQLRLAGLIGPAPPGQTDGRAYARLLDRAVDDGRGALIDAADELAAGRLDRAAFARIHDTAARFAEEAQHRPFALDARRDLIAALGSDRPVARALTDATAAFDDWLDKNPEAGAAEARGEMLSIMAQARAASARERRASLALPRFITTPRDDMDAAAVAEAAARLRDAHARRLIGDDDMIAQADLLGQWRDILAASKGGK